MVFTSQLFLFVFLPLTVLLYFISDKKYKNFILTIASLIFYSWGGAKYLILILILVLINYILGVLIGKCFESSQVKKICLIIGIIINLGVLIYFKYFNFIISNIIKIGSIFNLNLQIEVKSIILPIGISFFTFQILSYVVDVYRGEVEPQKNIINLMLYIMLFPQLIAGPIVRYIDVEKQINNRNINLDKIYYGVKRFVIGLAKKVLLSNSVGLIADFVFNNKDTYNDMGLTWIGIICYALQIYHDFSGYSDMAIGLGYIFGFEFIENFNYPYISKSVKEFWRRWHISLSTWFRDYLYIPLGGSRKGKFKTYRNLLIVFFITGLWHGASWNFIVWGLYYGVFLVLERGHWGKILNKLPIIIQRVYVILIILIGWVFFRADGFRSALLYIKGMISFNFSKFNIIYKVLDFEASVYILLAILFSMPIIKFISSKIKKRKIYKYVNIMNDFLLIIVFYISIMYITGSSYNPFIYFRF